MAIIANQSLAKGAASANFVLENSIQEAKKSIEEITESISCIEQTVKGIESKIISSVETVPIANKSLSFSKQIQQQEGRISNLRIDLKAEKEQVFIIEQFVIYLFGNDIDRAKAEYQKWLSKNEK